MSLGWSAFHIRQDLTDDHARAGGAPGGEEWARAKEGGKPLSRRSNLTDLDLGDRGQRSWARVVGSARTRSWGRVSAQGLVLGRGLGFGAGGADGPSSGVGTHEVPCVCLFM